MDDQEFEEAVKKLKESNARVMASIERMPPLTEAQKQTIEEILALQKGEHEEYVKNQIGIKTQAVSARAAWGAAQRALRDAESEHSNPSQRGSWPIMWAALALIGAILLFLKFAGW